MDVTAKYQLIGLMAYPIRHSLSPEMQNKALENDSIYYSFIYLLHGMHENDPKK